MIDYIALIQSLVWGFLVTLAISPFVISFIKREKVKQVILNYVESHSSKAGTPTMGGIIFIISISIVSLICFNGKNYLALMSVLIFVAYGLVGFLDDFIKFKFKRNLGLRPYQKIIFQLVVAVLVGFLAYKNENVGGVLIVPFTDITIDIGWWIIPLVAFIFIATTNSVNLTDGLDGLASSTTLCYMLSFIFVAFVVMGKFVMVGNQVQVMEYKNLIILASVTVGAMLSFLVFNCFPAKIFMGDTGSLALGSLVASVAVFSRMSLFLPILGLMFVLSTVSVIMQVSYYKLTKKRIFLMAPLHHHFEKKGVHEVRITTCYAIVTILIGALTVLFSIL